MRRVSLAATALASAALAAACAARPIVLPSGPGEPFPEFRAAFQAAVRECAGVRTWSAELGIAGRAGRAKFRGRAFAGLARPDALRLEGLAPFGQPVFILVARQGGATLLLPRDRRVLTHGSAAAIVEALTGVAISPDELRHIVTGCVSESEPVGGRSFGGRWHGVDLADGSTVFLRRAGGTWRIEAGLRASLVVEYRRFVGLRPEQIRVSATPPQGETRAAADLTLAISQVEINVALADEVFTVSVPPDAVPMTLEELRDAGPLGAGK
jgi:outer membrane biogenesis lipoprotein LolB